MPFPEPGSQIEDRFVLERPLARGAMGEVWVARVVGERTKVAAKLSTGAERARAVREAEALARLDHPGIVRHLATIELPEHLVLCMELVEGATLAGVLKSSPPTVATAIGFARQVAAALVHAHERGVVHRDVKASNLLVTRGLKGQRLVLIDFGLGLVEGAARVSSSDVVLGSVHTMPPEQLAGQTSDGRADVYSLGALLFRMICGRYPYHATSSVQVLAMHAHAKVPTLAQRAERPIDVPAGLSELLVRCLAKDPTDRPTAAELLAGLDALPTDGHGPWVHIEPEDPAPEAPPPARPGAAVARLPPLVWAAGAAVLAGLLVVLALVWLS